MNHYISFGFSNLSLVTWPRPLPRGSWHRLRPRGSRPLPRGSWHRPLPRGPRPRPRGLVNITDIE